MSDIPERLYLSNLNREGHYYYQASKDKGAGGVEYIRKDIADKEKKELISALEFSHGAIIDAIYNEDGLDGGAGLMVIKVIEGLFNKHDVGYTPVKDLKK